MSITPYFTQTFSNYLGTKNVPQSYESGQDPPPLAEELHNQSAFFWMASLTQVTQKST